MTIYKNALKITIATFIFSNFAFAQTTQNSEDIGACTASILVKVKRNIPVTENMRDFVKKITQPFKERPM